MKTENLKQACIKFFYWWWNEKGNNTAEGFDKWIQTEEGKEAASQFKGSETKPDFDFLSGQQYNDPKFPYRQAKRKAWKAGAEYVWDQFKGVSQESSEEHGKIKNTLKYSTPEQLGQKPY